MKMINIFGSPGVGKSTIAAGMFFRMKTDRYSVELLHEYAKDLVWSERFNELNDQMYVSGKQYHKQYILNGKVDYVITDSPIFLGLLYRGGLSDKYNDLMIELFNKFDNVNFLLESDFDVYDPNGRMQDKQESIELSHQLVEYLDRYAIKYTKVHVHRPKMYEIINNMVDQVVYERK